MTHIIIKRDISLHLILQDQWPFATTLSFACANQGGSCDANAVGRPRDLIRCAQKTIKNKITLFAKRSWCALTEIFPQWPFFICILKKRSARARPQKETAFNSFYGRTIKISAGGQYPRADRQAAQSDIKFLHRCILAI